MSKQIKIVMKEDGTVGISFDGFDGDECYQEADILKAKLSALGINMDMVYNEPTQDNDTCLPKVRKTTKVAE